jgi:hypothetical protein
VTQVQDNRLPPEFISLILRQLPLLERTVASHVCSLWRNAALLDPMLWFQLEFRSLKSHTRLDMLETLVSRAQEIPLELSLAFPIPPQEHDRSLDKRFATMLGDALPRTRRLVITVQSIYWSELARAL